MDNKYNAFLKVLDSKDNSTGGGSASCIAGSMAAGLIGMVARLSIGKKDLQPTEHYETLAAQAELLAEKLLAGSNQDSEAFAIVSNAFGMPKETDEEKAARSKEIAKGMTLCAEVPLNNASMCREVIELCEKLEKSYNTNASSDLECAHHLAQAGLKGCAANVRVNLPYLKDKKQVEELERQLKTIEQ